MEEKYQIPKDAFVIGSLGFIASTKQNELICKAVKLYNENSDKKMYYIMAGEGNYVDLYLNDYCIKTGFLNNHEYANLLSRFDVVFNLSSVIVAESPYSIVKIL